MEVTWCNIRAIRGMLNEIPAKFLDFGGGLVRDMWTRIVVVQANAFGESSSPAILNGSSEFFQCLAICFRVYCGPFGHKLD